MTAIDDARKLVESRLTELDKERERLMAALKELGGAVPIRRGGKRGPGRPKGATTKRRKRKGGNRLDQFVKFIADNPGATVADASKALKVKPNYLYRIAKEATKGGKVSKSGKGYKAKAAA